MRLLRDLWATSPRRAAVVACLIVLGAAGQAVGSAVAGPVLVHRSAGLFAVLAAALFAAVVTDLVVGLLMAGLAPRLGAALVPPARPGGVRADPPAAVSTPARRRADRPDAVRRQ